ncbi:hypothetical protein SAMN02745166_02167 [Prosthecobacter debontii]|uniref:Uncharacterized protein n=1 Tax=Prosthecobacter debontii TaxID=48467 RepID=A0A1T4XZG7_9BACT|nr:hypothetical protein SAMN02745166_02167 [Prosthecobacter debontii]
MGYRVEGRVGPQGLQPCREERPPPSFTPKGSLPDLMREVDFPGLPRWAFRTRSVRATLSKATSLALAHPTTPNSQKQKTPLVSKHKWGQKGG